MDVKQPTRRQMLRRTAQFVAVGSTMGLMSCGESEPQPRDGVSEPAADPTVGLGILGSAHIHLAQYGQIIEGTQGVAVRAVYDDPGDRAAELFSVPAADSLDALLDRADVQAVIILSENVKHEEYVTAAARAGKHVFVEKPLEIGADRAARAAEAVKQAGVLFQTGYFMRSQGNIRFIRQAIREGQLGKVSRLRLQYAHAGSLVGWWDGPHAWMGQLEQVGRGALGDLGIHVLDLLLWITQGDPIVGLTAHVGSASGTYGELDEFGEAMFRFESGLVATIAAGYVDHADNNQLEVSGMEGHAHINRGRLFVQCPNITGDERMRFWSQFDPTLGHPLALFLDALKGEEDVPLVPVDEAALDVAVMDKVYEAAAGGRWIRV